MPGTILITPEISIFMNSFSVERIKIQWGEGNCLHSPCWWAGPTSLHAELLPMPPRHRCLWGSVACWVPWSCEKDNSIPIHTPDQLISRCRISETWTQEFRKCYQLFLALPMTFILNEFVCDLRQGTLCVPQFPHLSAWKIIVPRLEDWMRS